MEILASNLSLQRSLFSNDQGAVRKVEDVSSASSQADPTQQNNSRDNRIQRPNQTGATDQDKPDNQASQQKQTDDDEDNTADGSSPQQLTEEEKREVEELKARDREVRAHEAAHLAAAGTYASSGPNFEYKRGPDGRLYAVAGEVEGDAFQRDGAERNRSHQQCSECQKAQVDRVQPPGKQHQQRSDNVELLLYAQ